MQLQPLPQYTDVNPSEHVHTALHAQISPVSETLWGTEQRVYVTELNEYHNNTMISSRKAQKLRTVLHTFNN